MVKGDDDNAATTQTARPHCPLTVLKLRKRRIAMIKRTPPKSQFAPVCTTSNLYDVVMTPPHMAGLMAKLADPQADSVVLDLACGTGNLLAACAQGQLVGIEQKPALLSRCRQRLPQTAHLYDGSCFDYA